MTESIERPVPIETDSRICFGIKWYATEAEAELAASQQPGRINGGWYDGQPTGRDSAFDFERDGVSYFAITVP
jgi:hypothetical protein